MSSIKPICKQEELDSVCAEIDKLGRFALDLEFIPEKTFNPVLALLQIATDKNVYIVDPLADLQLNELWQKVADKQIIKILHAAKEDLNIIRQLSNLVPQNIFDTQIAAGFLGMGFPIGYKKLLSQTMNIQINKSESFTDWLARPLSEMQLQYAFEDVCHLLALADKLKDLLNKKERLDWVLAECSEAYAKDSTIDMKDYAFTRIKGARNLSQSKLAVLQALCELRIDEARRTNRPLKSILSDITLLELSKKCPTSVQSFDEMRGINLDQAKRYGKNIIAAIEKAKALPQENWPNWPSIDMVSDAEALAGDFLYAILKVEAYQQGIATELIATRNDVQRLIKYFSLNCHGEKNLPVLEGWRHEMAGKKLLSILEGMPMQVKLAFKEDNPVKISFG